jgi:hypothetical protein
MTSGSARIVSFVGAIRRMIRSIVGLAPVPRTVETAFALRAIMSPLTIEVSIGATTLIAVFFESIGGRAEGVRRGPHGVSEAALKTTVAHCCSPEGRTTSG